MDRIIYEKPTLISLRSPSNITYGGCFAGTTYKCSVGDGAGNPPSCASGDKVGQCRVGTAPGQGCNNGQCPGGANYCQSGTSANSYCKTGGGTTYPCTCAFGSSFVI